MQTVPATVNPLSSAPPNYDGDELGDRAMTKGPCLALQAQQVHLPSDSPTSPAAPADQVHCSARATGQW